MRLEMKFSWFVLFWPVFTYETSCPTYIVKHAHHVHTCESLAFILVAGQMRGFWYHLEWMWFDGFCRLRNQGLGKGKGGGGGWTPKRICLSLLRKSSTWVLVKTVTISCSNLWCGKYKPVALFGQELDPVLPLNHALDFEMKWVSHSSKFCIMLANITLSYLLRCPLEVHS